MNYKELQREAKKIDCVSYMEYQQKTGADLFRYCPGVPDYPIVTETKPNNLDDLEATKMQIDEKYKDIDKIIKEFCKKQ